MLNIATLGIYSAWAKVRTKQYFYRNTVLDGTHFDYDANPIQILKGRSLVLSVLILIYGLSLLDPLYSAVLSGSLSLLMPLFIQRSLKFNTHYSSYRNLRFRFTGSLKAVFGIGFLLPLLFGISAAGLIAIAQRLEAYGSVQLIGLVSFITYAFFFIPYLFYRYKKFVVDHSWYGTSRFRFATPFREFCLLTAEFYAWILFGALLLRFVFPNSATLLQELLQSSDPTAMSREDWLQLAPILTFALIFPLFIYVLFIVRTHNMVFNHASLEGVELRANFTLWSYTRLCVSNGLILLLSCGLCWPLVRVRSARYKALHTFVVVHATLNHFIARDTAQANAVGDAVGDYLDIDFVF